MAHPEFVEGKKLPLDLEGTCKYMNKLSWTVDKGCPFSLGVGQWANNPSL